MKQYNIIKRNNINRKKAIDIVNSRRIAFRFFSDAALQLCAGWAMLSQTHNRPIVTPVLRRSCIVRWEALVGNLDSMSRFKLGSASLRLYLPDYWMHAAVF